MKYCFWCVKVCMIWKFIQYSIHWEKIENALRYFFFCKLQLSNFMFWFTTSTWTMNWSTMLGSLRMCFFFVFFCFCFFSIPLRFIKVYFFFSKKSKDSLTLKRHSSIKNETNATRAPPHNLWVLSCSKKF